MAPVVGIWDGVFEGVLSGVERPVSNVECRIFNVEGNAEYRMQTGNKEWLMLNIEGNAEMQTRNREQGISNSEC